MSRRDVKHNCTAEKKIFRKDNTFESKTVG